MTPQVFSGDKYWRFDDAVGRVELDYPRDISMWRGVPSDVDAAFQYIDGKTYFFKVGLTEFGCGVLNSSMCGIKSISFEKAWTTACGSWRRQLKLEKSPIVVSKKFRSFVICLWPSQNI